MSDEDPEAPRLPNIREMFDAMRPPLNERLDAAKKRQAKYKAALPHIRAARTALRELDMIGYATEATSKSSRWLAIEENFVESSLVWPVDP